MVWLTWGALFGCAEADDRPQRARQDFARDFDVQSQGDGLATFRDANTGSACQLQNTTQACSCKELPGRQVCGASQVWGACECLEPSSNATAGAGGPLAGREPPSNKGAATFEWLRTAPNTGGAANACKPGRYAGALDGLYNAPSAFNAPVPIVSIDVTGAPGLQLELSAGGNGEFLKVTGGKFSGVALAIFPFEAEFADGMLDCRTGEFRARIVNGTYVVFFDGFYGGKVMYEFEGEMVARYDAATSSLMGGRWAVSEGGVPPPTIAPDQDPPIFPPLQAGGTGTWSAAWTP
ncbi:MAG: hypothetical protein OXR73_01080 [Myxococcales bacterium]|nr:hypothetical protein [Myxococcales bacterium]